MEPPQADPCEEARRRLRDCIRLSQGWMEVWECLAYYGDIMRALRCRP